jgi:hypothetical protein
MDRHGEAKALDESCQIVGIFSDLPKTSDCVNHDILWILLHNDICGTAILWLKSYLQNRRQRAEIWHNIPGKTFSKWETIKSGVPLGSILGPLLLLLYINDLTLGIKIDSELPLYADDTSVLIFGNSIHEVQKIYNCTG